MSDDRWRRVEELFHTALGLPPDQRAAFLKNHSGADSEVHREVESLLARHNSKDSVFDQPAWADSSTSKTAPQAAALLAPGAVLGPYRITGLLGAGGMGQVYRAHDSRLQRAVAIKVMAPGQDARRFEREARAVAALSHPNVVPIFDVGQDRGVDYLVEELVEGESLRDLLRRGPVDVVRCRRLAVQIAEGLAAAHRAGIVHRDLKPGNIMVSSEDCARILDFGLATSYRIAPNDATISMPQLGAVVGTAAYVSPEQIQGGGVDSRSDIFSYGAVLYEMITGRQAFARDTIAATLAAVLQDDPPPVEKITARVPHQLSEVIQRCLSKEPGHRFQTIDEVRLAINGFKKDAGPAVAARRRQVAASIVVVTLAAAVAYLMLRPASRPEVSGFVPVTKDGIVKEGSVWLNMGGPPAPLAADATRVYFTEGGAHTQALAQISASGGERAMIPTSLGVPQLLDFQFSRSEMLVTDLAASPTPAPLWTISLPAGTARRVGDIRAGDAAWSPDGSEIAFVNGRDLFRTNKEGSETKLVAHLPGTGWRPRWSPSAAVLRLTIEEDLTAFTSLWEVRSDGTNLHPLLPGWNQRPAECCGVWSPDGNYYVFQSSRNGRTEIWALREKRGLAGLFDRGRAAPVQVTSGQMNSLSPTFSPDGKTLYVIGEELRGELQHLDKRSMQFVPYAGGISGEMADFSPDGRWITYVAVPGGALWRSRLDGSDRLQLTSPSVLARVPRWSPDGKSIAVHAIVSGRRHAICIIPSDGGRMEQITPGQFYEIGPVWFPDGGSLLFSSAPRVSLSGDESGVYVVDLRSRQVRKIPGSQGVIAPEMSPDGRYIVATSMRNQSTVLFDFQTGAWTEMPGGKGIKRWSRDGKYVYFLRNVIDPAVMRIRISDQKAEVVASLKGIRQTGELAGISFTLDPDESPVILRDVGIQEIYSLAWKAQ